MSTGHRKTDLQDKVVEDTADMWIQGNVLRKQSDVPSQLVQTSITSSVILLLTMKFAEIEELLQFVQFPFFAISSFCRWKKTVGPFQPVTPLASPLREPMAQ